MPARQKAAPPSLRRFPSSCREEDYGKITVGDIIARAHVGRATFYGLFKSKDDLLAELVRDICTHALDDDGTPLDDPLVQVEHILNNLWERRQGVRALVAGAGSRVFADCLRKTIMSRAAETVPTDPNGPAATMDRSFLLHHIASSFVGMVQWWAWHNFQARQSRRSQRLPISHKTPLQLSKKLIPKFRPHLKAPPQPKAQSIPKCRLAAQRPYQQQAPPIQIQIYMLGCLLECSKDPAAVRMG